MNCENALRCVNVFSFSFSFSGYRGSSRPKTRLVRLTPTACVQARQAGQVQHASNWSKMCMGGHETTRECMTQKTSAKHSLDEAYITKLSGLFDRAAGAAQSAMPKARRQDPPRTKSKKAIGILMADLSELLVRRKEVLQETRRILALDVLLYILRRFPWALCPFLVLFQRAGRHPRRR